MDNIPGMIIVAGCEGTHPAIEEGPPASLKNSSHQTGLQWLETPVYTSKRRADVCTLIYPKEGG
jgi:hypothetical protein